MAECSYLGTLADQRDLAEEIEHLAVEAAVVVAAEPTVGPVASAADVAPPAA